MNSGPGVYGPHTQAAVARLQQDWGISGNDGQNYGPQTRDALTKTLAGQRPSQPPSNGLPNSTNAANSFFVNQRGPTPWNSGKLTNGEGNGSPTHPYGWYDCVPTSGLMALSALKLTPHPGADQAEAAIDRVRDTSLGFDSTASQAMALTQLANGLTKMGAKTAYHSGSISRGLVDGALGRGHPVVLAGDPWNVWGNRLAGQGNYLDVGPGADVVGNHAVCVLGKTADGSYLVGDPLNRQGTLAVSARDMDAFMATCFESLEVSR